jgi:hypothetical protein
MNAPATSRARITVFAIVVAAIVIGAGAYLYRARVESSSPPTGQLRVAENREELQAIARIRSGPHVAFRDMAPGPTYGRMAFAPLESAATRLVGGLPCQRLYFSDRVGVCLVITTAPAGFRGYLLDDELDVANTIGLPGMPSRARVSRDSEFAAFTAFVAGDSYLASGLSTRTRIVKMPSGDDVADLESFAVVRDGQEIYSVDFNFWGVTFTRDANRIYATLGTGGRILLVHGDVAERTFHVVAEDIECPSLSPDGKHIAFKKRFGSGLDAWWQPAVVDLATMTVRLLPEPKHIDDQIEWLDDATILYAVGHSTSSSRRRADVWKLAIDGNSPPSIFLADAESPAIVRPGH